MVTVTVTVSGYPAVEKRKYSLFYLTRTPYTVLVSIIGGRSILAAKK
jgi:hypothetical protein